MSADMDTSLENLPEKPTRDFWYDMGEVRDEMNGILEELLQIGADYRIRKILGNEILSKLRRTSNDIRRRMNDDFSSVVVGDFKRGKSSFINALLGEQIVTTNVTPETVTINCISYNEEEKVEAVLKDGRRMRLDRSELKRDTLSNIISKLPVPVEYIDIKVPIESLQGIRIVDTPGVGDLLRQFDQQVNDYLIHADAVIYLISALSPFSETEQAFVQASLMPQEFPKLFIVINLLDCIEEKDDATRLMENISKKVSVMFPNSNIFGISALDEYCLLKGMKRPNMGLADYLVESFRDMRDALEENVLMQREMIQLQRVATALGMAIKELERHILLIRNTLQMNKTKIADLFAQHQDENSELSQNAGRHKDALRSDIHEMYAEAEGWMKEFLQRIRHETISSISNCPLDGIQKHFHFFMIDVVREAIGECVNTHLKTIIEGMKSAAKAMSDELSGSITETESTGIAKGTIIDVTWTELDTANSALMMAAQIVPGLGTLVSLGQLALGFGKNVKTAEMRQHYIEQLRDNMDGMEKSIITELKNIYERLIAFSEQRMDETYRKQMESSLEAIQQAQKLAESGEADSQEMTEALNAAQTVIGTVHDRLREIQEQMSRAV